MRCTRPIRRLTSTIGLLAGRCRLPAAVTLALLVQVSLAGCGVEVDVHREYWPPPPRGLRGQGVKVIDYPCEPSGPESRGNFVRWSRDGASIVFYRFERRDELAEGLYWAAANGTAVRRIKTLPEFNPDSLGLGFGLLVNSLVGFTPGWHAFDVAPDGRQVVYSTCSKKPLWGESGDTPNVRVRERLEDPLHYRRIARTELFYSLVRARSDGTASERLGQGVLGEANYPSWSPDGKRIALQSSGLVTMAVDGSSIRRIAFDPDATDAEPNRGASEPRWLLERAAPQWSPDSQRLAVTADRRKLVEVVGVEMKPPWRALFTVGANGADPRRLVVGVVSEPAWSPDGQRLAYARLSGDQNDIVLATIAADGTDERYVATIESRGSPHAWIRTLAWSPDGTHLLHSCGRHLCVIGPDGTPVGRTPVAFSGGSMGVWSPDGARIAVSGIGSAVDGSREVLYTMAPDGGQRCPVVIDSGVVATQRNPFEEIRRMLFGSARDHPMVPARNCRAGARG